MTGLVVRRVASLLPLLLGLSIFSFALGQLAPGDPARSLLLLERGTPPTEEQVRATRVELGLDDPAIVQYGRWVGHALTGDLGRSFRSGQSVTGRLRQALPVTAQLALLAFLIVVAVGIPLGVGTALAHGRLADHVVRVLSVAGASIPTYGLGYLLIIVFSVHLHLGPASGVSSPAAYILPALTLSLYPASAMVRLTRASMLDVLGEDFIRSARARGIPPVRLVVRHALRVALNPVLTYGGLVLGGLLGGAVIVEKVFGMPGIGKLVVDSINLRDVAVVQGFVLLFGTTILLLNLAVDLLYAVLDPRVRLSETPRAPDRALTRAR
jgi:ABC-type dipeptide/oligopeptide/nickel transport system permease component